MLFVVSVIGGFVVTGFVVVNGAAVVWIIVGLTVTGFTVVTPSTGFCWITGCCTILADSLIELTCLTTSL